MKAEAAKPGSIGIWAVTNWRVDIFAIWRMRLYDDVSFNLTCDIWIIKCNQVTHWANDNYKVRASVWHTLAFFFLFIFICSYIFDVRNKWTDWNWCCSWLLSKRIAGPEAHQCRGSRYGACATFWCAYTIPINFGWLHRDQLFELRCWIMCLLVLRTIVWQR